jgi:ribosome biogenesis GTPase
MRTVNLEQFGWNGFFASQVFTGIPGRVATANHGRFLVWTEGGEIDASVSGALRQSASLWPAVGDWVVLRDDVAVISQVLVRKTKLSRKQPEREVREQVLAANIDVLFIVSGLDHDFNERRIERFLVMAHESGARPVILLNKADLAPSLGLDLPEIVAGLEQMSPGVAVLPLSALSEEGLGALSAQLAPGETAALIGSSGVGKSTILNRLLGVERQRTNEVRGGDSRGRHTTTSRELFMMPGGWLLMDLPGLREVQLWTSDEPLEESFDDIQKLAGECRFRNCAHAGEPGCAVSAAGIDPARLANYLKMQKELAHLDRRLDPKLTSELRARSKTTEKTTRRSLKRGRPNANPDHSNSET